MDAIQFLIGIFLIGATIYSIIPMISPKKQAKTMPESKQDPAQTIKKVPERPKTYSELMQTISADIEKTAKADLRQAGMFGSMGKPKEFHETVDKEYLEAENIWAIDEYGIPTERNVANDKTDIPLLLGQYKNIIALVNLFGGLILLFVMVSGL